MWEHDWWALVFARLHSKEDRDSVSLTCRRWRALEALSRHTLHFSDYSPVCSASHLQRLLQTFPCIRSISITATYHITDTLLAHLPKGCPALIDLTAVACGNITDVGLISLAHGLVHLESLDVTGCTCITDDGIDEILAGCPSMKKIILSECWRIEGWGLRNGKRLEVVNVWGCDITDAGFAEALLGLTNVLELNMGLMQGPSSSMLAQIGDHCKMLEVLCIQDCKNLDDLAVQRIAQGCINLKILQMAGCSNVTLSGWHALAFSSPKLHYLDVDGCHRFCSRSLQAIQNGCPSLIHFTFKGCNSLANKAIQIFEVSRPAVKMKEAFQRHFFN